MLAEQLPLHSACVRRRSKYDRGKISDEAMNRRPGPGWISAAYVTENRESEHCPAMASMRYDHNLTYAGVLIEACGQSSLLARGKAKRLFGNMAGPPGVIRQSPPSTTMTYLGTSIAAGVDSSEVPRCNCFD